MANIIRSAKSSNDWTINDLDAYHISFNQVNALTFFGLQELPEPLVDQELLTNVDATAMQQDYNAELIHLLDLAIVAAVGETAVDDFAVALLRVLGYIRRDRVARTRLDLPFFICGEYTHTKADICIIDRHSQNDIQVLPVQVDRGLGLYTTQVQLVAVAIAAFNENNTRRGLASLEPLREAIIPGIVMTGTLPSFYKICVTEALSDHLRFGTHPPEETRVIFCCPPRPGPGRHRNEGMKPLENRHDILRCYEAFKAVVGI